MVPQPAVYAAANWHAAFVFFRTAVHELSDRACACVRKWSIFRVGLKRKNVCLFSHSRVMSGGAPKGPRMATLDKQNHQRGHNDPEYKQQRCSSVCNVVCSGVCLVVCVEMCVVVCVTVCVLQYVCSYVWVSAYCSIFFDL